MNLDAQIIYNLVIVGLILLSVILLFLIIKNKAKKKSENKWLEQRINELQEKYSGIIDLDKKVEENKLELSRIQVDYKRKRKIYHDLLKEVSVLEEKLEFMDYGVYEPHFDYDTSERYKEELKKLKTSQKQLIKAKSAVISHVDWEVGGSKTEGRKMTNKYRKLMLRAFNGECDSAILKTRWNNELKMEKRIMKSFEMINKMGETHKIEITNRYLQLKLNELRLTHEYKEKKHEEKEEQKRIKAQIKEEERAQKEAEKAREEAEKEERRYEKALEKARKEIGNLQGVKLEKMKLRMQQMEQELEQAKEMKERAISQAQLTKSGHVYVISNIGSFGDNIYKIGMTRRLEPMDRVKELGDASVPFPFDVHAMIYSENAPELENNLHKKFEDRSLNLVNKRKEFFNVTLDEIEEAVIENFGEIEFTKLAEAREYHESTAKRKSREGFYTNEQKPEYNDELVFEEKFPESI